MQEAEILKNQAKPRNTQATGFLLHGQEKSFPKAGNKCS
jgi:hypothetical protein